MSDQTVLVASMNTQKKTVEFFGSTVVSVLETLTLKLYGAGNCAAANLKVGLKKGEEVCTEIDGMTDAGGYYTGELDLSTDDMVDAMEGVARGGRRPFVFYVWDTVEENLLANSTLHVYGNPYEE